MSSVGWEWVCSDWCRLWRLVCILIAETICLFLPSHKLIYLQSHAAPKYSDFCLGKCKLFQPQTMMGFQALNILFKFTSPAVERMENFNCFQKKAVGQMYPLAFFILILQFQRKIMLSDLERNSILKCFDFSLCFFLFCLFLVFLKETAKNMISQCRQKWNLWMD